MAHLGEAAQQEQPCPHIHLASEQRVRHCCVTATLGMMQSLLIRFLALRTGKP